MNIQHTEVAEKTARVFSQLPEVQAVAVAGSQTSGMANTESDIDVYIYTTTELSVPRRMAIAAELADDVEVNDFWGPGNEWTDRETGVHVDAVFWTTQWIKDQLDRVLLRNEASMGYTTCFWQTVRSSIIYFDRDQWLNNLQNQAIQAYPEALIKAILAQNYPVLRQISSSYLNQLKKAANRGDLISLNHRTAALFASYFDILFAINRVPHPGEKRLIDLAEKLCPTRPPMMRTEIYAVLEATVSQKTDIDIPITQLLDSLDEVLKEAGFLA